MSHAHDVTPRPARGQRRWVVAALFLLFLTLLAALPTGYFLVAQGTLFSAKPGTRVPVWQIALTHPGMGPAERWKWLMAGGQHMAVARTTPCKSCHR